MGNCWSDTGVQGERFEVIKQFKEDGDPMFYTKQMNKDVEPDIERHKRIHLNDGLGREDTSKSIITIQY
jgi:hypothetical protein